MALPSATPANFPQGLDVVTINAITYIADAIDIESETTRNISRTDENGDYAESQTRASSDPIECTMTLQRALTSTVLPTAGTATEQGGDVPQNMRAIVYDKVTALTAAQAITAALLERAM